MLVTEFLDALPKEPTIADQTMVAIRALGRLPKRRKNPVGDAQIAENKLARKMVRMGFRIPRWLSESLQTEGDSVHGVSADRGRPNMNNYKNNAFGQLSDSALAFGISADRGRQRPRRLCRQRKTEHE